jgi:glycosyltransferase involved in cell wall biosynthesis
MKILLYSRFHPNVGGIESVAALLAREWLRAGADITVVSDIAAEANFSHSFGFPVYYRPGPVRFVRLLSSAEIFVHMNLSLRALWPLAWARRPLVVVNHAFYYCDRVGNRDWRERLKLRILPRAANIAVSRAVAAQLPVPCAVIANPVDLSTFGFDDGVKRTCELAFVGRLVSDKGCDLLIRAVGRLSQRGLVPRLTVIGDGPERPALEQLTAALRLTDRIEFTGGQTSHQIAARLRQHEILVMPSLVAESFGVAALEGAACGCVVLGADAGGLPEAIGPAGLTFRCGDEEDLTAKIESLLWQRKDWHRYRHAARAHLAQHEPARVARRYLEFFAHALNAPHGDRIVGALYPRTDT